MTAVLAPGSAVPTESPSVCGGLKTHWFWYHATAALSTRACRELFAEKVRKSQFIESFHRKNVVGKFAGQVPQAWEESGRNTISGCAAAQGRRHERGMRRFGGNSSVSLTSLLGTELFVCAG